MKTCKHVLLILLLLCFVSTIAFGQGLLNKIKTKAAQEVSSEINKQGKESSSSSSVSRKSKLSANVTRAVVATIGSDEVFDYSENCIDLGASLSQVSFIVTQRSGSTSKCFAYKNGKRTPVDCPGNNGDCNGGLQCSQFKLQEVNFTEGEGKKYVITKSETRKAEVPAISDQQMKMMEAYMTKEQLEAAKKQLAEAAKQTQGQTYEMPINSSIVFNGKQYGPFKQVIQFFLSPESKNFYAIVSEDSQAGMPPVYKIITSSSPTVLTAPGYTPPLVIAAPDASEFAMYAITNEQKNIIVTSSGKTYQLPQGALNSAWYAGGHMIAYMTDYTSGNKLYRDGQIIKTYNNESPDLCSIFVASDGKVTEIKNNTILFGDGDVYEFPLKTNVVNEGGKSYFKWIALEDREVVVYQKPY